MGSFKVFSASQCDRFVDLVLSVLDLETSSIDEDVREGTREMFSNHAKMLERLILLLCWTIKSSEAQYKLLEDSTGKANEAKRSATASSKRSDKWNWPKQLLQALNSIQRLLNLSLSALFDSSVERDAVLAMVTKTIFQDLCETQENFKQDQLRGAVFHILCTMARDYDQAESLRSEVLMCLRSQEFLAESMASLVQLLYKQYELPQIGEQILKDIGRMVFRERDSVSSSTRSIARFLVKGSELFVREMLRAMVHLQDHVDADSYTMRCAMLEVIGNLIIKLQLDGDTLSVSNETQVERFFDVLIERFRDSNAFVRSKLLQVLSRLCELRPGNKPAIPKQRLLEVIKLAIGRLKDKTINVRRQAIKFLTVAVDTHPFSMDSRKLSRTVFEARIVELEHALARLLSSEELSTLFASNSPDSVQNITDVDATDKVASQQQTLLLHENVPSQREHGVEKLVNSLDPVTSDNPFLVGEGEATNDESNARPSEDEVSKLQLIYMYYCDERKFVGLIDTAVPLICTLLGSANRQEVVDAMDFFHLAEFYKIEAAEQGLQRMIHLVWSRDLNLLGSGNDVGGDSAIGGGSTQKSVRECLLDTFGKLFFLDKTAKESAHYLLGLCNRWSLAELTSLETLLALMSKQKRVPSEMLDVLWTLTTSPLQSECLGATMLLSMFALCDPGLISAHCSKLVRTTLQPSSAHGLTLAKYGSIALQRLSSESNIAKQVRYASDHLIIQRLCAVLLFESVDEHWVEMAEQAVNAVYVLAKRPDVIVSQVIATLSKRIFGSGVESQPTRMLAQLLFVVGHVAIKQIVHLELIEAEWKRRLSSHGRTAGDTARMDEDDLGAVVGGAEDEAAEALHAVREQELLFGKNSLLSVYGPLIVHICANKSTFSDVFLQRMAVLALCKLMCVSCAFCEAQLPLFLTILSKTADKIIQSNMIIALGDIAVCFNALVDRNIDFLYKQLSSVDLHVKKNALMVLSHLVLNGMVKVKGQISEMAKCLEDDNQSIRDLTRLFFSEFAAKDNAVYNHLPDIISNLSSDPSVNEEEFQAIMRFLFNFCKRERQLETMIEKLCQRFAHAFNDRYYRDIGFCLSLLPFSTERSVRKLIEHLPHYQNFLHDDVLYSCFTEIISRARKSCKGDIRLLLSDLEVHINDARGQALENYNLLESIDVATTEGSQKAVQV